MSNIREFRKQIEKQFGQDIFSEGDVVKKIPSGITSIDLALGGGYPKGRIIEIRGWESSGKTTVALQLAAEIQKQKENNVVVYLDYEYALDTTYMESLGIDLSEEKFLLIQPTNSEQGLDLIKEVAKEPSIGLIVVDSIAAMVPQCILEGETGDAKMGVLARQLSKVCPTLLKSLDSTGCIALFINQYREKIGVMYGDSKTTPGGNAMKFYASQVIEISRMGQEKDGEEIVANKTRLKVLKNKVATPFKKAEFFIKFGEGIDKEQDFVDTCISFGIFERRGAWYFYNQEKMCQGSKNIVGYLDSNPQIKKEIYKKLKEKCN